jgi:hypothetical protein
MKNLKHGHLKKCGNLKIWKTEKSIFAKTENMKIVKYEEA